VTADSNPDPRRRRVGSFTLALVVTLWLSVAGASIASASKITDLRIGAHDDFTRVVFELDRPTGYRIERASPTSGVWELVVTLDATSLPRKVQSQKGLIGLVLITPEGSGSVARIQLTQDGLSLKEMILANPPRIVLDVLSPTRASATAAAKSAPPPKADTKPAATLAKTPAKTPAATTAATPAASKPAATVAARPTPPAPVPTPPAPVEQQADWVANTDSAAARDDTAPTRADSMDPSLAPDMERVADSNPPPADAGKLAAARDMQGESNRAAADRSAPAPAAERVAKRVAMPPVPATTTEPESGLGFGKIGMGIAGLLVLAGAVFYLRRRSSTVDEEDDFDEGVEVGGPIGRGNDNPFANLRSKDDRQPVLSAPHAAEGGTGHFDVSDLDEDDEKEVEGLDAPLIGESGITFGDSGSRVQGLGTGAGVAGGLDDESPGDEETMRIIREIEQRMASLESRLDEAVDARERLERQVAAQTEELRVQRAAIARTQRAVRNMNRPDEEGPTEPALRETP
jgi:hypothetical protein